MNEDEGPRILEARRLAEGLRDELLNIGEINFLRGIDIVIRHLRAKSEFGEAASVFKSMLGGYGSFSDYVYWSDDADERLRVNRNISKFKDRLIELFDAS